MCNILTVLNAKGCKLPNVYFVATDFYLQGGYASYRDFFKLVELSGYPIIPLSQLDPQSDNTYIVTPLNDEWMAGWPGALARIIHLELEWRWDWRADVDTPPGVAEVWAGDRWFAGSIGARYVPLGSHLGLNTEARIQRPQHPLHDVALMMYRDPPRRAKIVAELKQHGLHISDDGWGEDRSVSLIQSRCMVAIHQLDNMPAVAPLRMCIAAAHRLPVISEKVNDAGIFNGLLYQAPYADLASYTRMIVRDPYNSLTQIGEALYQLLCVQHTFRKSIEIAL